MPTFLWRLPWLCLLPLVAVSCGGSDQHLPTFPVRGEAFLQSQPAAGALVILHPQGGLTGEAHDQAWAGGYPRATVQSDGSFVVGTYAAGDGAPAGAYAVLVQWPTFTADEESSATEHEGIDDRLQGKYLDPKTSPLQAIVKQEPNDLGRLELK